MYTDPLELSPQFPSHSFEVALRISFSGYMEGDTQESQYLRTSQSPLSHYSPSIAADSPVLHNPPLYTYRNEFQHDLAQQCYQYTDSMSDAPTMEAQNTLGTVQEEEGYQRSPTSLFSPTYAASIRYNANPERPFTSRSIPQESLRSGDVSMQPPGLTQNVLSDVFPEEQLPHSVYVPTMNTSIPKSSRRMRYSTTSAQLHEPSSLPRDYTPRSAGHQHSPEPDNGSHESQSLPSMLHQQPGGLQFAMSYIQTQQPTSQNQFTMSASSSSSQVHDASFENHQSEHGSGYNMHISQQSPTTKLFIPMRKHLGWPQSPQGGAHEAHQNAPQSFVMRDFPGSPARTTPDSESSASVDVSASSYRSISLSSSAATSSSNRPPKKKKSKMHECEICGKQFPRYVLSQTYLF